MQSKTSYKQTATAQIITRPGILNAYFVGTDGANNVRIQVYDVAAAADVADTNCIVDITVVAASRYGGRNILPDGLEYYNGLYTILTGVGGFYFIEYKSL